MTVTTAPFSEAAIRRLVDLYFSAIDSRDPARLRACFTHDAEFTALAEPDGTGGITHHGIDAVVATLDGAASFAASCHVTGNVLVEVDGDTATADTFAVAFVVPHRAGAVITRGLRYRDVLARTGHEDWRIRRRVHCPLWQSTAAESPLGLPVSTEHALSKGH